MNVTIYWRVITDDEKCFICHELVKTAKGFSLIEKNSGQYICEECGQECYPELMKEIDRMSFE